MPWEIFHEDLVSLLAQTLSWRSRRHEIIAGNVANLDTPGYTRKDLDFREVLSACLSGGPRICLVATHPTHLRPTPPAAGLVQDSGQPVDLDREMVEMATNQLNYQAEVQMLNRKLENLRTVLRGDLR
ncbi:MAG: flagellar basal body rod protein FlgB [Deltaproteobacteria bacterium]|nr:flagellar basal body rod protein FlgB [Deltaproteobacteria bacterium]